MLSPKRPTRSPRFSPAKRTTRADQTKREKARAKAKKKREQQKESNKARRKAQQKARREFDLVQPEALGEQRRYIAGLRVQTERYLKIVRDEVVTKIPMISRLEPDEAEDETDKVVDKARGEWENLAALLLLIGSSGNRIAEVTGRRFNAQVTRATGARMVPQPTNTRSTLGAWTRRNLRLIRNAVREHGVRIAQAIAGGVAGSRPVGFIVKNVITAADVLRRKIVNIGRDQSEKLESQLNTSRLQSLGVKTFTWQTVGDDRVRPLHASIEGQQFPVGKGHPTEGMPGDAILCRCSAAVNLPKP